MTTKPPTTPLEHIKQARATADGEWSYDERLEAPEAADEWEWRDVLGYVRQEITGEGNGAL